MMRNITITSELLQYIAELDEFKGLWVSLKRLSPDKLHALRSVATIESIASSTRIEGVVLSDREVEHLLSHIKIDTFKTRDEEEVVGYAQTLETVFENYQDIPLSENYIKKLHSMLLHYSKKDQRHKGDYKKFPNNVEAFDAQGKSIGIVFETSTPFDTPQDMEKLVVETNDIWKHKQLHPLIMIGIFIVRFLAIHPFQDGNGRLSRILTTLLLLKSGYYYVLYASLENIIEHNKEQYYLSLRKTQKTLKSKKPNWLPWLTFFLKSLVKQKDKLTQKIHEIKMMEKSLSSLSLQIVTLIEAHGRITISEIEALSQIKRGTLKNKLNELIERKIIERHGKGPATWYTLS